MKILIGMSIIVIELLTDQVWIRHIKSPATCLGVFFFFFKYQIFKMIFNCRKRIFFSNLGQDFEENHIFSPTVKAYCRFHLYMRRIQTMILVNITTF